MTNTYRLAKQRISVGLHKNSAMVMLRTEKVSDEMMKTLADGFGVLVQVLKALGTPEGGL